MSAVSAPALPIKTIASHVAVPLVIGFVMALAYIGGFHKPNPHDLRIDVIGSGAQTAVLAQTLQQDLGDRVSIRTVGSVEQARAAIERREIAAAFAPQAQTTTPTLFVSTAASDPTAVVVERIFGQVTIAHNQPLKIIDVVPADPQHDPTGQSIFFFLVALTVGSYGCGIAIAVAAGGRGVRVRLGFAAASAVIAASVITALAVWVFDALPGAQWQIFGLSILYAAATMLFAIGLHPLIGRFTTLAMVTVFVGLNFTSCGGVFAPQLQPAFFGVLHDFWIGAGLNEAARNLAYFPQVAIAGDVAKIIGWFIVGLALVVIATVTERRRAASAVTPARTGRHERAALTDDEAEELAEDVVA
ncbi:MAG: hypothetical protein QM673_03900 [Gordonia sp. (in: high G+C Gram-positive bacteria)]